MYLTIMFIEKLDTTSQKNKITSKSGLKRPGFLFFLVSRV